MTEIIVGDFSRSEVYFPVERLYNAEMSNPVYIVTALHCEAKPLIERYGLKKNLKSSAYEMFSSEGLTLCVSGIGKVKAACATTYILSLPREEGLPFVLNIGICGACEEASVGDLFLVNKITDRATSKEHYPDQLLRSRIRERSIETFDSVVTDPSELLDPNALVDMEASGFYDAAARFVPPSKISCLKVVSDKLEAGVLSLNKIEELVSENIEEIEVYIKLAQSYEDFGEKILSTEDESLVFEVSKSLKLTSSQERDLRDCFESFTARTKRSIQEVCEKFQHTPSNKFERNRLFAELKSYLMSEV